MNKDRRISPERIIQYAKETFLGEVDDLLLDPSELIEGRRKDDKRVALINRNGLIRFHELAQDLGMNFNALIKERGDAYQRERIRRLLAGEPSDHKTVLDWVNRQTELLLKPETTLIKKGDVS